MCVFIGVLTTRLCRPRAHLPVCSHARIPRLLANGNVVRCGLRLDASKPPFRRGKTDKGAAIVEIDIASRLNCYF